jgi:hypothetical protein
MMRAVVLPRVVATLLAWLATAVPVAGQAQVELEEEARIHFMAGRAHYEKGAFMEAAVEFEAAYRVSGHPKLLYNVYLAYRDGDAPEQAARALREYLEKEAVIENRQQLEARLKVLESRQGQAAAPPPLPPAPEPSPTPAPSSAAVDEPSKPVLAFVLMGLGGAVAVASIPMFVIAGSAGSDVDAMCPNTVCADEDALLEVQDLSAKENTFTALSYTFLLSGVAILGTGIVMWLLHPDAESDDSKTTRGSLGCHAHGCYGELRLQF